MHCVDLGESFPTSIYYLLAKFGFDTAENESSKVVLTRQPAAAAHLDPARLPREGELELVLHALQGRLRRGAAVGLQALPVGHT